MLFSASVRTDATDQALWVDATASESNTASISSSGVVSIETIMAPETPPEFHRDSQDRAAPTGEGRSLSVRHRMFREITEAARPTPSPRGRELWEKHVLPKVFDSLREHPVFLLEKTPGQFTSPESRGTVVSLHEADREPLYNLELLRIFRSRIRLASGVGFAFVPIFTAFFFYLSPQTSLGVIRANAFIMLGMLLCMALSFALNKLVPMRVLAMAGYIGFCVGAASVVSIVNQDILQNGNASRSVQFVVLGSFIHILLSILLLPFAFFEAILATMIALASMFWGIRSANSDVGNPSYLSQIFVVCTTACLILIISYLSAMLRKRAFHSAFDLALQAARMQEMSATDQLTGAYNRRHIEGLLATEIARAGRFSHSFSLLMFDLDNFKPVNDSLGHSAGDEVLREIWSAACAVLREVDTLARFGGDEFLILLPETGALAARGIAERLRAVVGARLREKWGPDSLEARITLSLGVLTLSGRDLPTVAAAISRVDELLYDAKRSGKNCMVFAGN